MCALCFLGALCGKINHKGRKVFHKEHKENFIIGTKVAKLYQ